MQKTENRELADLDTLYVRAASTFRQARDQRVTAWRDMIHNALMETPVPNFAVLHDVMDDMDRFLNTSKRGPLTD